MQGTFEMGEKQGALRGDVTRGQGRRHGQPVVCIFAQNGRPHMEMAGGAESGGVGPGDGGRSFAGICLFDVWLW